MGLSAGRSVQRRFYFHKAAENKPQSSRRQARPLPQSQGTCRQGETNNQHWKSPAATSPLSRQMFLFFISKPPENMRRNSVQTGTTATNVVMAASPPLRKHLSRLGETLVGIQPEQNSDPAWTSSQKASFHSPGKINK